MNSRRRVSIPWEGGSLKVDASWRDIRCLSWVGESTRPRDRADMGRSMLRPYIIVL
jgi:hypothetical protein